MAGARDRGGSGPIPFWVHQLVELLLGVLLMLQGARTGEHTVVLLVLGGALALLALTSDGALAAWPWIRRRTHRVADFAAAAVLALSPLLLGLDDVLAIVLVELAALAMVWLALRTNWSRPSRRQRARLAASSPPSPSTAAEPTAEPAAEPRATDPMSRRLGAVVGRARDDGPRRLGRAVGRARRATAGAGPATGPDDPVASTDGASGPSGPSDPSAQSRRSPQTGRPAPPGPAAGT
jgi:hypothetical protein